MTARRDIAFGSGTPDAPAEIGARTEAGAETGLAAGDADAILVEPGPARLLAAGPIARRRLGLAQDAVLPITLDAGMPALAVLRSLLSQDIRAPEADNLESRTAGPSLRQPVSLVFWIEGAAVAVPAIVEVLSTTCVRLTLERDAESEARSAPGPGSRAQSHDEPRDAPDIDDEPRLSQARVLADVAARIRAGMDRRWGDPLTPDARLQPPAAPATAETSAASNPPAPAKASAIAIALARLGHELRTPLSAMAAMAEIIRDERFGPDAHDRYREYAGNIYDSARHALALVGAMLDPETAVERQEPEPTFVEIDVAALVKSCRDIVAPLAERAGLAVEHASADRLPHLVADARALRQILLNLLTNALKFTPRDGTIAIRASCDADGPLRIMVSDTGIGMTGEERAHILHAMASGTPDAGSTTTRAGGGRGLGLPMVHRLAAQSGGAVAIDSSLGLGTTVTLTFDKSRLVPV